MITFGQYLRGLRTRQGLTLDKLAQKTKTQKGYLSGIETGAVNPPAAAITRRLADVFGIPREDLLLLGWAEKAPQDIKPMIFEKLELERKFA